MKRSTKAFSVAAIAGVLLTGCSADFQDSLPNLDFLGSTTSAAAPADATGECTNTQGKFDRTGCFGKAWIDVDKNGCDTRNDILSRDLTNVQYSDAKHCKVESGVLVNDPYTGKQISFKQGKGTSKAVQIDHVYAVSAAFKDGAGKWDPEKRVQFANDPLNLIAVDGPANASKSDDSMADWVESPAFQNESYKCDYIQRYKQVATKYQLPYTVADQKAESKHC